MTNKPNDTENYIPRHGNEPKKGRKKGLIIALSVVLSLVLIVTGAFFVLQKVGSESLLGNTGISKENVDEDINTDDVDEDIIIYGGAKHKINENIVSILFLGIDKEDISESDGRGENGQADTIFLACIDTVKKSIKIIPIPRDVMTDVDRYSVDGSFAGTKNEQICLSYAYGSDAESGCENVKNSVSRLLCGINISSYVAIDLKGIEKLADAVGGVTVTSIETIGSFKEGKNVTLKGKKAKEYVQLRGNDVESSNRRLARQKQFLTAFASTAGNKVVENFTRLVTYYQTAVPYITTDLSLAEITYLAKSCLTQNIGNSLQYLKIKGETVMGEKHAEFYADSDSVFEAVLDAFYIKFN